MPAATTHVEFAKDVYLHLPAPLQKQITDLPMFLVGSQGPDLLFFSGFSVLPSSMQWIGGKMHDEKIYKVIQYFDEHAVIDDALRSYFYGYLCHYALDANVHPLVYCYSQKEAKQTGRNETEIHFRIEGEYDVHVLKAKGRSWKEYNVYESLKLSDNDVQKLAILYEGMLKKVFSISVTRTKLMRGIRDVSLMTRLLKPSKLKYATVNFIENTLHAPKLVSGMMLSDKKQETALNANHLPWSPVFDGSIVYHDSFDDLYAKASDFAIKIITNHDETDFTRTFCGEPVK